MTADGTRPRLPRRRGQGSPTRGPRAYGGFGLNTEPGYPGGIQAWLDRGGIYAEAIIRGGAEFGEGWHRAGMGKGRASIYADFIAASEFLIREKWTSPKKLVIRGSSAGGPLVTVAMTTRPDLYAAVIAEVPLTDNEEEFRTPLKFVRARARAAPRIRGDARAIARTAGWETRGHRDPQGTTPKALTSMPCRLRSRRKFERSSPAVRAASAMFPFAWRKALSM